MIPPFEVARLPALVFGAGSASRLGEIAARFGSRALLVTGVRSLAGSGHRKRIVRSLSDAGVSLQIVTVNDEPSPERVDEVVAAHRGEGIELVLGIGGGSALDAAKAVAGLLPHDNSVMDHLEGVGAGVPYRGPSLPFLAVPTTAGTGSEATRNAVLGARGAGGFKKSFRHEALVARCAVVDPSLLESCPPTLIASGGMDALTQLVESFVSTRRNRLTNALAISGLEAVRDGLLRWYENPGDSAEARSSMAYASLISGICLAQTGLGSVHGLASPLGALHPIPHGVVCGTLLASATRVNVAALRARDPEGPGLEAYARVAEVLVGEQGLRARGGTDLLVRRLEDWTARLRLPCLGELGVKEDDLGAVVSAGRGSSMKTNPIVLTDDEMEQVLRARL